MTSTDHAPIDDELLFEASYKEVEPELVALPARRVKRVNLDVPSAVAMVLGIIVRLRPYRDEFINEFRSFDAVQFDRLELYTMALSHAHALYVTAGTPPEVPKQIYDQGYRVREMLHQDIGVLIARNLIPAAALKGYRGLVGYENVASEIQIECQVLRANWPEIDGKCATNLAEIDQASRIAAHLLRITRQRDELPELVARAADRRNRCYTMFINSYSEARYATQYLRRHEQDADDIAPPLHSGRSNGKKDRPHEPAPSPSPDNANTAGPATPIAVPNDAALAANGPFLR